MGGGISPQSGHDIVDRNQVNFSDVIGFTEAAQDAVGAMIDATLLYVDATPLLGINLGNANTWTAKQIFSAGTAALASTAMDSTGAGGKWIDFTQSGFTYGTFQEFGSLFGLIGTIGVFFGANTNCSVIALGAGVNSLTYTATGGHNFGNVINANAAISMAGTGVYFDAAQTTLMAATTNGKLDTYFSSVVRTSKRYATVSTTDATQTNIMTLAVPTSTVTRLRCSLKAYRTGGSAGIAEDSAGYLFEATFKVKSGTATQVGTTTTLVTHEDQAGWDFKVTASGGNLGVDVIGAVNNNIKWELLYDTE
jgi:hypothetical protein